MSDDYVRVFGTINDLSNAAVLFAVGASVPRAAWIPRSLLHAADDLTLKSAKPGDKMTIRMREWKADELGFATSRDPATTDLFERSPDMR